MPPQPRCYEGDFLASLIGFGDRVGVGMGKDWEMKYKYENTTKDKQPRPKSRAILDLGAALTSNGLQSI